MKGIWIAVTLVVLALAAIRTVAMLPPETFKEPIFASEDGGGDGGGYEGEATDFA